MEIIRFELFLHEKNLIPVVEALKTWIKQNTALSDSDQSIKQKINIEIGQTPDNLKICPLLQNMR